MGLLLPSLLVALVASPGSIVQFSSDRGDLLLGAILGAQDGSCRVRDATGVDHPAVPRKSIRRVVARALVTASLGESAELQRSRCSSP